MITTSFQGQAVITPVSQMQGKSTDTKPTTGIVNGSTFLEMDTSRVYMFDEEAAQWVEL